MPGERCERRVSRAVRVNMIGTRQRRDVDHLVPEFPSDIVHRGAGARVNAGEQPKHRLCRDPMPQPPQILLGFDI